MILLLAVACSGSPADPDAGFAVVGTSPADGAVDVVEAHIPEVWFNAASDPAACTTDTVRIDALYADGSVAFAVPLGLEPIDGGVKLRLRPEEVLPEGWSYALTVADGDAGCASTAGDVVRPHLSTFLVP